MVASEISNSSKLTYLGAAIGSSDPAITQELNLDQLMKAVSHPAGKSDALVGSSGRTVAECLEALVNSGNPEDCEFVMNCALGTGEIATRAKSLLTRPFACSTQASDATRMQTAIQIRSMAQNLVEMVGSWLGSLTSAQPELLLLAGTVFPNEASDEAIPSSTRDAIKAFNQNEWRPAWWVMQPPGRDGTFSITSIEQLKQGFEGIPERIRKVDVQGDGSCMFRSCLSLHLGEERWVHEGVSKDELYNKLIELGWDRQIKSAIGAAYDHLSAFLIPSPEIQRAFDVEVLFDRTIGSRDFSLYSPVGISTLMEGLVQFDEAEDFAFFEALADSIAQNFIESSGVKIAPAGCGDPGQFEGNSAWLVLKNAHYDLLVTDGFFSEPRYDLGSKA